MTIRKGAANTANASNAGQAPLTGAERLKKTWDPPKNLLGHIFMPVNNKIMGVRFMVTAFIFLLIGGLQGLLMRTQLIVPENDFLDPTLYNQLFTMHGSTMMFLFIIPFLEGLAIYVVPAMIGARDMAFPRLSAFGYWTYLLGGLMFYSSFLIGQVPDTGWFAYTPLSSIEFSPGTAQDLWLVGLAMTELSGISAGVELIVTILKLRSPGMSLTRMPLFIWAMLVTGFAITFAFSVLFIATLLLELERSFGLYFFNPDFGGSPLLWQHLFWIFGHPEVYIMFIPGTGIVSTIVPTMAGRPMVAYRLVVLALIVTGFVSFGLWVHHMFTTGLPELAASFFTASSFIIALATGTQIFAWIATLWGTRPKLALPMLYIIGFFVIFMLGGVTGVMVASVPVDWQVHDSFFVVAHFHYVIIGGSVFPILGAIHYWLPKITGHMMNRPLGLVTFWLVFIGFNVAFFPMHISGLLGMPRRVYTYDAGTGLYGYNLVSTIGSYVLGLGFLLFVVNVLLSVRKGKEAGRNPWQGGSLEWSSTSPPPSYSVGSFQIVRSRVPLWPKNRDHREPDEESLQNAVNALDHKPETWRAGLVTSAFGGEPRGAIFYPGPTLTPFSTSLGVFLIALALLLKSPWLGAAGVVVVGVSLIYWLWPNRKERELNDRTDRLLDPEGRISYPGNSEVGSMGAALYTTVTAVVVLITLFCYLYLVGFPGPTQGPEWVLPAVAAAALLVSALLASFAGRRLQDGDSRTGPGGLLLHGLAIVLGLAYLGVHAYALWQVPFPASQNGYTASFYTVNGALLFSVLVGLILAVAAFLRILLGHFDAVRPTAYGNFLLYWWVVTGLALLSFLVLYLVPLL